MGLVGWVVAVGALATGASFRSGIKILIVTIFVAGAGLIAMAKMLISHRSLKAKLKAARRARRDLKKG